MASLLPRTSRLPAVFHWLKPRIGGRPSIPLEDFVADDRYVLRAELPGLDPQRDIKVSATGRNLSIVAERRKEEKAEGAGEFRHGERSRDVELPVEADLAGIEARYHAGILEISVPMVGVGKTHTIPVKAG
ncbi:Hsp20/alpha crystallin family protein [Amycolatopsis orientalis]|uniref:Hsp20/alpha crystallin family protein n=1 Tax=Amycolatopsis orientalis TaxID=31958 RepID=UPI00055A439A|nr:Hsp20/alpha crystallin family protein [Amycolatopsis orientalis]